MKKFLILGVVTVVALAALSVGYAMWQKTLTIDGVVNTGNIGAEWSLVGGFDSEPAAKDVSRAECALSTDFQTASMTIINGYPSIDYMCVFDVHSTGSVPVHLAIPSLDRGDLPQTSSLGVVNVPADVLEATQLPQCTEGFQLHTDTANACLLAIGVHLYNDAIDPDTGEPIPGTGAAQNAVYNFSGELMYHQWNETP